MMTRDELLVLLIEECGEVIQAATKCLRFGWNRDWPGYGRNDHALAKECGDLEAVFDALSLDSDIRFASYRSKIGRAEKAKATLDANRATLAQEADAALRPASPEV